MKILFKELSTGRWMAWIEGEKDKPAGCWATGATRREALGDLVWTWREKFGLEMLIQD